MESGNELIRCNEERIYVSVRLRPLNSKEISRNDVSDWECINDKTIVFKNVGILASERSMYPTAYTFDRVFRSNCSTREVYEQGAKDVAISVVNGINSSVFAYGQTSSGKTYTMTGITEYAIADLYDYMQKVTSTSRKRFYFEIFCYGDLYNESVRDLLSEDGTQLRLLDDPERGTIVEKLTEEIVRDWDHVIQLLSICEAQRQIGETSLNETSSRSHQIIRLTIESSSREFLSRDNSSILTATVNFVDLAGSERASQSLSAGTRLKEGCHINRSLLTLGTVIRKLSKGRNGHIPYRDSKLTRILQTSLGGNARTAIICTMSPARTHVEQSRNTLLFASCAKELEKEIKDLILQRDVAQSQVNDLLRMLGDDDASSTMQVSTYHRVGLGDYPHLRVQKSPDAEISQQKTSKLEDPRSMTVDPRTCSDQHSRTSSEYHFSEAPYSDENFVNINATPRILISSSSSSSSDSYHGWAQIDKLSNGTSEDLCREVRCIEPAESSNRRDIESNHSSYEVNTGLIQEFMLSHLKDDNEVLMSSHLKDDNVLMSSHLKDDNEVFTSTHLKEDNEVKEIDEHREMIVVEEKESVSPIFEMEKEFTMGEKEWISPIFKMEKEIRSVDYFPIPSLGKLSSTNDRDTDPFGNRNSRLVKSKSCKASITTDSGSPWLKMMDYMENTPSVVSEKEYSEGFEREMYPLNVSSMEQLLRKDFQSPPKNALDIEIDTPAVKGSTAEDGSSSNAEMRENDDHPNEEEINKNPEKEIEPKANESPKKNVKDVGLDPIEDNEFKGLSSWPVEFKRLQREIIELWDACNVALVHRTYFFLLFQGDPTDAIYLEVEMRRMKFLKDKYSRGEKTVLNGKRLTLASSAKALRQERRMLSEQMMKKFTEQERESLFVKWGIGLKTKYRRLQLANRLWTNTEDMNHIDESAFLVAKLVGFIEPGQAPTKEMFGLNFAPRSSDTKISSFKRSLISIL
ncbi:hypothetical protein BUALT_Bualt11G0004300 [Buddleja alternifolia]|uniref:Kinesin-like protein n=1 Tax=Buddleja alternifolia TaxID=168488 RepID=A0AAV6WZI9_9LAMI|nr:hypothetical protein BUALT_Bualt11G0004300 [Buddleja alternifolia]